MILIVYAFSLLIPASDLVLLLSPSSTPIINPLWLGSIRPVETLCHSAVFLITSGRSCVVSFRLASMYRPRSQICTMAP